MDDILAGVPEDVWSKRPFDVGHRAKLNSVSFQISDDRSISRQQYLWPKAADQGMGRLSVVYETQEVTECSDLEFNIPLRPVLKADMLSWAMVND